MSLARLLAKGYKRAGKGKLRRPDGRVVSEARAVASVSRGGGAARKAVAKTARTVPAKKARTVATRGGPVKRATSAVKRVDRKIKNTNSPRFQRANGLRKERKKLRAQIKKDQAASTKLNKKFNTKDGFSNSQGRKSSALANRIARSRERLKEISKEIKKLSKG